MLCSEKRRLDFQTPYQIAKTVTVISQERWLFGSQHVEMTANPCGGSCTKDYNCSMNQLLLDVPFSHSALLAMTSKYMALSMKIPKAPCSLSQSTVLAAAFACAVPVLINMWTCPHKLQSSCRASSHISGLHHDCNLTLLLAPLCASLMSSLH